MAGEHLFAIVLTVDRPPQLEDLRRSLAMFEPRSSVTLHREDVINLIGEVQELRRQVDALQRGLAKVVEAVEAER